MITLVMLSVLPATGQLVLNYHADQGTPNIVHVYRWDKGRNQDLLSCWSGPGQATTQRVRIAYGLRVKRLEVRTPIEKLVIDQDEGRLVMEGGLRLEELVLEGTLPPSVDHLIVWFLDCGKYDHDNDGDVDLRDFATEQRRQ